MKEYHDICNDLCCIIGHTEILMLSATDEETKSRLKSILNYADRITSTLKDMRRLVEKSIHKAQATN
jgi:uncharacterized protein YciW